MDASTDDSAAFFWCHDQALDQAVALMLVSGESLLEQFIFWFVNNPAELRGRELPIR